TVEASAFFTVSTCSKCNSFDKDLKSKTAKLIPGYLNGLSFMKNLESFKRRYDNLEKWNKSLLEKCNNLE
ncbi:7693_t:CDS:1, partial [Gigaspora rosea]